MIIYMRRQGFSWEDIIKITGETQWLLATILPTLLTTMLVTMLSTMLAIMITAVLATMLTI